MQAALLSGKDFTKFVTGRLNSCQVSLLAMCCNMTVKQCCWFMILLLWQH
jgi:hypothetical protein